VQQTAALYNTYFLGTSAISILDTGWPYSPFGGVIEGNYTVLLQAGLYGTTPADTTLSQNALVPAVAQSLRFKAYDPDSLSPAISLQVSLGGQQLSLVPLGTGANYTLYGADIHTLAGQTTELDFTVKKGNADINYVFLDSIQFSNLGVPEPGVLSLSVLGALLLGGRGLGRRQ